MSEKKSWDIQPSRRRASGAVERRAEDRAAPQRAQARPAAPQRSAATRAPQRAQSRPQPMPRRTDTPQRPSPKPQQKIERVAAREARKQTQQTARTNTKAKNKAPRDESLKGRRRRARQRNIIAAIILLLLIVGGGFASIWWSGIRVETIAVSGPDSDGMKSIAANDLIGTYKYIFPRNSIFFLPTDQIRTDILKQYPDISALTISRISFNAISITSIPREAALTWCGETYPGSTSVDNTVSSDVSPSAGDSTASSSVTDSSTDQNTGAPSCYSADAQGVIFAIADPSETTSPDSLRLYAPLAETSNSNLNPNQAQATSSPLGSTIAQASYIPNALQFIKIIKSLGVPIVTLVLRGDEADLYAQSGTRITYVLGREEETAQVAQAVFPSLNINNGSLEYVDLRFAGKAYYKAVGADTSSTASST